MGIKQLFNCKRSFVSREGRAQRNRGKKTREDTRRESSRHCAHPLSASLSPSSIAVATLTHRRSMEAHVCETGQYVSSRRADWTRRPGTDGIASRRRASSHSSDSTFRAIVGQFSRDDSRRIGNLARHVLDGDTCARVTRDDYNGNVTVVRDSRVNFTFRSFSRSLNQKCTRF